MSVLLIAEHDNRQLNEATLHAAAAATLLGSPIRILLAGYQCETVLESLKHIGGISEILYANHPTYEHGMAESLVPLCVQCVVSFQSEVSCVVATASSFGKNIIPAIAAKLNVSPISDVIEIVRKRIYKRPMYAGNAIATVESYDALQILTIRRTAFPLISLPSSVPAVTPIEFVADNVVSRFISKTAQDQTCPELSSSRMVISGGRGLKTKANFERLTRIALRLGAAIGATRAAVDANLAPNEYQVGQTGQIVAPEIYFAVGISGAIQHLAGMKDSKIIVAINKDPEAPIFKIADYALVADIDNVLPEWEAALDQLGY